MWDPSRYLRFADERSRPFFDLLARVDVAEPASVVDLGCGPGSLTAQLLARWPSAEVVGLDSSPEMIEAARALGAPVRWELGDLRDWHAGPEVGVVTCNAVLQWVPGHEELLTRWAGELSAGAVLAVQVPGNFASPSHRLIRDVAALPRWSGRLDGLLRGGDAVLDAVGYATLLTPLGCEVDAWETTYLHQLPDNGGEHPVLRWVEGTALRPVRSVLGDEEWSQFRAELSQRLTSAYPISQGRAWFPFRRIFVVARRG